jgi:tetratricopeptide (TPR) repeat protein
VGAKGQKYSLAAAVRRARLLHELGDRKRAGALLDELAKPAERGGEDWEWRELIALLNEVGRRDQAFEVWVRRLTETESRGGDSWQWSALFPPERGRQAWFWWAFLRSQDPMRKLTVAEVVKTVRQFVEVGGEGKPSPERVADAVAWARLVKPDECETFLNALADWCHDVKLPDRERECLQAVAKVVDTPAAWQRLGEHDAGRKKWKEAAESFKKSWEKHRTMSAPLWLAGWALEQGGDVKEGARLMERARWAALGDLDGRVALAEEMEKHGRVEDSRREMALLFRLCPGDGAYLGDALDALEAEAAEKGDYRAASGAAELSMLEMIYSGATYLYDRTWVTEPGRIHLLRGRGLLAGGKVDEAMAEASACLKLLPGDVDVPIHFVPALRKLGRTKEADALIDKVRGVYADLMRDYPDWGGGHNALAWMYARCRMNLDEALTHARKAVELRPEQTAFLDTLAEVHFQKGDTDKAIELMKKCLEREPENDFYRKQLKRYEAGDPRADVPDA